MDIILLFSLVIGCLLVSFFCSISEAAIFAIPVAVVRHEAEAEQTSGKKFGRASALQSLKDDISAPISAMLILNTIANTACPAIAGALAENIFGPNGLIAFTVIMSILVLFAGEVLPKFLGVTYHKTVALVVAKPLTMLIVLLRPLIQLLGKMTAHFEPEHEAPAVSHEEVLSLAAIGGQEGTIDPLEGEVISNVIGLDKIRVGDLVTPRVSVFKVAENLSLGDYREASQTWSYTRIPVYAEDEPDHLTGYVRQRDVLRGLLRGELDRPLSSYKRPIITVPELMRADRLLLRMFDEGEHLYAVVDEHGTLAGIISMEDILEHVVGREIHDEYDR